MFKVLLLQQCFNLLGKDLSEDIADRLSFRSYLGLPLADPIPEDTTFCRFRQKLQEEGLLEELFLLLGAQFKNLCILAKRGSFRDATAIQAQRRPPLKAKKNEKGKEVEEEAGESYDEAFCRKRHRSYQKW